MQHFAKWQKMIIILLSFILIIPVSAIFYALSIIWFKQEIARASYDLVNQQALECAAEIGKALPEPFLGSDLTVGANQWILKSIRGLMGKNPNIAAVFIIDQRHSIVMSFVSERGGYFPVFQHISNLALALQGGDDTLMNAVQRDNPDLSMVRVPFGLSGSENGYLRVFIDRQMPPETVEMAAAGVTAKLTMVMAALLLVIWLSLLILRRQQRLAGQLRVQRDRAEQLAYVGTLAAGLAHEIRNPLNALTMQLEMLEEDAESGDRALVGSRLQRIRAGLAGVESTVNNFLTYAMPDKQKPYQVELTQVVEPLCREYEANGEQGPLQLEIAIAAGLSAWCDPHALRQIIDNLVSNALRAQQESAQKRIRIEAVKSAGGIELTVEDAGPGIPEPHRRQIFDAFYTTRSDGTGLGLPIARRLAEMNGGKLELAEKPSVLGGAKFVITLPLKKPN